MIAPTSSVEKYTTQLSYQQNYQQIQEKCE